MRCKGFGRRPTRESWRFSFVGPPSSSSSSPPEGRLPSNDVMRSCMCLVDVRASFSRPEGVLGDRGVAAPGMRSGEGDSDDGTRSSNTLDGIETASPSGSDVDAGWVAVRGTFAGDPLECESSPRSKPGLPNSSTSICSACPGRRSSGEGSR